MNNLEGSKSACLMSGWGQLALTEVVIPGKMMILLHLKCV